MGDGWWMDDFSLDTNRQTGRAPEQFDQGTAGNTTYSPPGELPPIDQFNFVPDPNAPGGYQNYGPGVEAPVDLAAFSNADGTYPDSNAMAQAIAAGEAMTPQVDAAGNATNQPPPLLLGDAAATANALTAPPPPLNMVPTVPQPTPPGGGVVDAMGRRPGWGNAGAGFRPDLFAQGYGVPGFGAAPIPIIQGYLQYLQNQNLAPGYIPGSGTYNQFPLNQPGLFGTVAGQPVNLRYGLGGTGDPTTGYEPQTPAEWINGPKLFTWNGMMGQGDLAGLDYIATLFGRGDTPSGIGTPTFNAPEPFWQGLLQAIASGKVQPTERGRQLLEARGYTVPGGGSAGPMGAPGAGGQAVPVPESYSPGQVRLGGAGGTAGTGAAGAPGAGGGPMGPGTEAFNYHAAYLAHLVNTQNMNNKMEQDKLAFERVKQAWLEQFQKNQTSLGYLGLQGQLRGPADIFQYLKVLNATPGGIRDVVNAAAGQYRMPRSSGAPTVGGGGGVNTGGADSLDALMAQMNDPNYGSEAQGLNLPLPNQINAQNFLRMQPAQQQVLLAAYEAAGYRPEDVVDQFTKSLPQYAQSRGPGQVSLFR